MFLKVSRFKTCWSHDLRAALASAAAAADGVRLPAWFQMVELWNEAPSVLWRPTLLVLIGMLPWNQLSSPSPTMCFPVLFTFPILFLCWQRHMEGSLARFFVNLTQASVTREGGTPNWENAPTRWACGQAWQGFSWLIVGVGGPSLLWAGPLLEGEA